MEGLNMGQEKASTCGDNQNKLTLEVALLWIHCCQSEHYQLTGSWLLPVGYESLLSQIHCPKRFSLLRAKSLILNYGGRRIKGKLLHDCGQIVRILVIWEHYRVSSCNAGRGRFDLGSLPVSDPLKQIVKQELWAMSADKMTLCLNTMAKCGILISLLEN
jgi:hypothetical protein